MLKKTLLINLSLGLASILLALLVGEVFLRLAFPSATNDDPILGVRATPGGDWDKQGFRNKEILKTADIVAIGDSQTEGNNATREEAWPQVLGELEHKTVYQMAIGGYGPVQYRHLFTEALKLQPAVVIVGLYLGNDLLDAERTVYQLNYWQDWRRSDYVSSTTDETNYRLVLANGLEPDSLVFKVKELRNWLRNNLRLYALVGNATRSMRERLGLAATLDEQLNKVATLAETRPDLVWVYDDAKLGTVLSPAYRLKTVNLKESQTAEGWRLTLRALNEMANEAKDNKTRLLLVVIPTKEAVYSSYLKQLTKPLPANFTDYNRAEDNLANQIKNWCRGSGVECVFALEALTKALSAGKDIYGQTMDGHPLPAGYRVIAETLNNYFKF